MQQQERLEHKLGELSLPPPLRKLCFSCRPVTSKHALLKLVVLVRVRPQDYTTLDSKQLRQIVAEDHSGPLSVEPYTNLDQRGRSLRRVSREYYYFHVKAVQI